jgi:hypothetical protein
MAALVLKKASIELNSRMLQPFGKIEGTRERQDMRRQDATTQDRRWKHRARKDRARQDKKKRPDHTRYIITTRQ